MAEGPTVRYNAERFHLALAGKKIRKAFWRSRQIAITPGDVVGRVVDRVDFAGKNHLFFVRDLGAFRVHFMMYGSSQVASPKDPLRKPESRVRFLLEVRGARVVVFSAPVVQFYAQGAALPFLDSLGPDALKTPFDAAEFERRLAASPQATVAQALLDPSVVAGVGNIWKSEILWDVRVHPATPPAMLSPDERRRIVARTPAILLAAYDRMRRGERSKLAAYRRSRQPCPRCATPILGRHVGGRGTFWCPRCQEAPGAAPEALNGETAVSA